MSCIEVKTCKNGYYLELEYLRVFLEELESCAYIFVLSLKLLYKNISSSGGALSFNSC